MYRSVKVSLRDPMQRIRTGILVSCLMLLSIPMVSAQDIQISGSVTDAATKEPLPGVNIIIEGSQSGSVTDMNGKYQISVSSEDAVLVFSSIGFNTERINVNGQSEINVVMVPDIKTLDEVVVIGYGTARRGDLAGAISSINSKALKDAPVSSTAEAITGRLPGVQILTTDGSPDAEVVIRVRGGGSVTQDNSPLFIVDGFPVKNINDIPPTDIASIDVLKDASSSAIYGARGANGVIIITTKNAQSGKTVVSYNGYVQKRYLPKELNVLSPYEFVLAQYEYNLLRGETDLNKFTKYFGVYDDLELYKYQKGTDWQNELFGRPNYSQYHNISITGGTDKTKSRLSFTNNNDQGILVGSGYQRTNIDFKLNHEISKSLKLDLNARFTNTDVDGAGTSGTASLRIGDGITTRPVNGIADFIELNPGDAGNDYEEFIRSLTNPKQLAADDYRKKIDKTLNMNAAIDWNIMNDLVYRTEFGVDYNFEDKKRAYGPLTSESKNNGGNLPIGEITSTNEQDFRWVNTLSLNRMIGELHSVNFMVGHEMIINKESTEKFRARDFPASIEPARLLDNMASGIPETQKTFIKPDEKWISFFGRANYIYANKYILNTTLRADASNKFATGNHWGFFPAIALAWRISEENFMKGMDFISNLKVRTSYGQAGNDRIPEDSFRPIFQIETKNPPGFGNTNQPYYVPAFDINNPGDIILPNPDLIWETTVTRNVGLDFGLLNRRISGAVDLYWNTTKNLLVKSDIPSYLGYKYQWRNIGQTSNKGIEFQLNGTIIEKHDFTLSASFNIGFNRNKIDKLDGVDEKAFNSDWTGTDLVNQDDYRVIIGETVGLIYGYVSDGFYSVDDFESYDEATGNYVLKAGQPNDEGILGSPIGGLRPGMLKLKNLGGDSTITSLDDRTIIGNANPLHSGGFNINASYKGFDLSLFFNWKYGNDVYNTGKIEFNMYHRTLFGNMLNTMNSENRFMYIDANGEEVTDLAELGELNKNATIWTPFSSGNAKPLLSSYAIEDGSFLRLNNVTLGYSLPGSLISKIRMTQFRFYFTVYNAWLWTKYTGYDPDVTTTRKSEYPLLTPGVDYSAYPRSRSFTLGVNITF